MNRVSPSSSTFPLNVEVVLEPEPTVKPPEPPFSPPSLLSFILAFLTVKLPETTAEI